MFCCSTTTRSAAGTSCSNRGLVYESRSGLIALLHRLGLEYHKPEIISRKLDPETQQAFIAGYENLMNSMGDDEVAVFVDAVHPTHAARPVGCSTPTKQKLAIEQTSGRDRINIHGAIDLESGQTRMIEAESIDGKSTIRLLEALEALYPFVVCIHVFLDNASYHDAKLVKEWLSRPGHRIKLHFLPVFCPHLNPIERLWGVMHKNITHNQMLRDLRRIRGNNPRIPARRGAQKVGRVLRFGHRQFSYNFTQGFSAPGVSTVYLQSQVVWFSVAYSSIGPVPFV